MKLDSVYSCFYWFMKFFVFFYFFKFINEQNMNTEFNMDIMSQGYSSAGLYIKVDDDAVMKIHKNDDGTYQISVEGVKMYPATSVDDWSPNTSVEPYISDFTFNGDLFIDYRGGE